MARGENIYKRKDGRYEGRYISIMTYPAKLFTDMYIQEVIQMLKNCL